MSLKNEQLLDALMFCSDTLQELEKEHDPIIAREAKRAADGVISDLLSESNFSKSKCMYAFQDNEGRWNCHFHDSSVGYCEERICPLKSGSESRTDNEVINEPGEEFGGNKNEERNGSC